MSSALASRFLTTVPSGKSLKCVFWIVNKFKKEKRSVFSSHWDTRTGNLKFCKHTIIRDNMLSHCPLALCVCVLVGQLWQFVTPWTVALQPPLSMEFSRKEYWSGLPVPFPGYLPKPGIEHGSPALQTDSLSSEPTGKPHPLAKESQIWQVGGHGMEMISMETLKKN